MKHSYSQEQSSIQPTIAKNGFLAQFHYRRAKNHLLPIYIKESRVLNHPVLKTTGLH